MLPLPVVFTDWLSLFGRSRPPSGRKLLYPDPPGLRAITVGARHRSGSFSIVACEVARSSSAIPRRWFRAVPGFPSVMDAGIRFLPREHPHPSARTGEGSAGVYERISNPPFAFLELRVTRISLNRRTGSHPERKGTRLNQGRPQGV